MNVGALLGVANMQMVSDVVSHALVANAHSLIASIAYIVALTASLFWFTAAFRYFSFR
jgi:hypothetical protein